MKKFERTEMEKHESDVQNIDEIMELTKKAGAHISREEARNIYREQLDSEFYINDKYLVRKLTKTEDGYSITHLSIRRLDRGHAKDWREFQQIKNELLGEEVEAIELYPAESRLVDCANQFHLWALPEGEQFPFGFVTGAKSNSSVTTENHTLVQRSHGE